HDPARAFVRDHLEVIGLAADHDAERDIGIIAPGIGRERDGGRNLERARHGYGFVAASLGLSRAPPPAEQHVVQMAVETGLDDENMRHYSASPGIDRSPTIDRP